MKIILIFALKREIKSISEEEEAARCETIERQLNSRCKGLLESHRRQSCDEYSDPDGVVAERLPIQNRARLLEYPDSAHQACCARYARIQCQHDVDQGLCGSNQGTPPCFARRVQLSGFVEPGVRRAASHLPHGRRRFPGSASGPAR